MRKSTMYRKARPFMQRRTVLKEDRGVLWDGASGERVLWTFVAQRREEDDAEDLLSEEAVFDNRLAPWRVYRLRPRG